MYDGRGSLFDQKFNSLYCTCSKIVDKVDKDGDGSVTEKELEDWIRHVGRR